MIEEKDLARYLNKLNDELIAASEVLTEATILTMGEMFGKATLIGRMIDDLKKGNIK